MGTDVRDAICVAGGRWRKLELDFWKIDAEVTLKKVLDKATALEELKVYLDSPFKSLLTLNSSFAISHQLRHLTVYVDPRHTPELSSPSYDYPATPASSPHSRSATLVDTPFLPFAPPSSPASPPLSPHSSTLIASPTILPETTSIPVIREWRRFLKKQHKLELISWRGRGGLGTWKFDRSSSTVKVEFTSVGTNISTSSSVGEGDVDLDSPSRSTSLSFGRSRRKSSVSLVGTCLEYLELSPSFPSMGLGLRLDDPKRSPTLSSRTITTSGDRQPERERAFPPLSPTLSRMPSSLTQAKTAWSNLPVVPTTPSPVASNLKQTSRRTRSISTPSVSPSLTVAASPSSLKTTSPVAKKSATKEKREEPVVVAKRKNGGKATEGASEQGKKGGKASK
ncbi:hypothetical protein P7C70_g1320, partial [Phenoliferia sp. Uapishka_3]